MPLRLWKIYGGLRPWVGEHWSFMIKTQRIGKFGKDWFTDAQRVFIFGPFVFFYHTNKHEERIYRER